MEPRYFHFQQNVPINFSSSAIVIFSCIIYIAGKTGNPLLLVATNKNWKHVTENDKIKAVFFRGKTTKSMQISVKI
jgi:hypothetical protein